MGENNWNDRLWQKVLEGWLYFKAGKARGKGGLKIFDEYDGALEGELHMTPTQSLSGTIELQYIKERNFHLSDNAMNLGWHDNKMKIKCILWKPSLICSTK